MSKYDLAIVGGGWAGLSAATHAVGHGLKVVLFERARELGGRSASFYDESFEEWLDHGPHVFIGAYRTSLDLLRIWKSEDGIDFDVGQKIPWLYPQGKISWLNLGGGSSKLNKAAALLKFDGMSLMERMKSMKAIDALRKYKLLPNVKEPTVSTFLKRHGLTPQSCSGLWDALTTAVLNGAADKVGVSTLAQALRDGLLIGGDAARIGVPIVPFRDFLSLPAARYLAENGVNVQTGVQVKKIGLDEPGGVGTIVTDQGEHRAKAILTTVSPSDLAKILHGEIQEQEFFKQFDRFDYSLISAVHIDYDRPVLAMRFGYFPDAFSQWVFGRGKDDGDGWSKLSVVISNSAGKNSLRIQEVERKVAAELRDRLPAAKTAGIKSIRAVRTIRATVLLTPEANKIRPPVVTPMKNLYLAGDWTDTGLPATIEGAARSGEKAIKAIIG